MGPFKTNKQINKNKQYPLIISEKYTDYTCILHGLVKLAANGLHFPFSYLKEKTR